MPDTQDTFNGTKASLTGHPLPRRASPGNSVTLRHHRLARDASLRASPGSAAAATDSNDLSSPRRNSSGESHDTGHSDPRRWFDQSNQNPTATFDNNTMDLDPPFFQRESDSSNESKPYLYDRRSIPPKLKVERSSSGEEYRSVIDDLTVEIQRLKEELKRYKQLGPDMLRKEKLFEIKVHGLPKRKKRELESTLRDFAAGLEGSPDASSSQKKKASRRANPDRLYSTSESVFKDAPSSSGSNIRPADSAYASMSTGAHSSGTSLNRPSVSSRQRSSEQKVENYLRDIPEGLYPRHMVMTEKEKKKLVVRRLEHIFTGKKPGRHARQNPKMPPIEDSTLAPVVGKDQNDNKALIHQPPTLLTHNEPSREARILPSEQQPGHCGKKSRSRDNVSASNSYGDQTESGGNGNSSGSGTNTSPSMPPPPEQRPTRPKDLDPDRTQVPSENMDYIRHLGLVPPELLSQPSKPAYDVHPDADGWVYLNLLCSLAQLHIINVTPDFVRGAVSEMSTKFQLSPDGRKIRWRGGTEGTRFNSDSSGDNSQRSPSTDETDGSEKQKGRKRQKTGHSTGENSGNSSGNASKFGPQVSASSESFHYKPLFVHQDSSNAQTSMEETASSFGPGEESNLGESRWGLSGSGTSNRRKRRHDGAIIYYSGAPFCTDLSGDPGDVSPTTYMLSSSQSQRQPAHELVPPPPRRSHSGSFIDFRPLSDKGHFLCEDNKMDVDTGTPALITDDSDDQSEVELDFTWSDDPQYIELHPLEPCGLGGVLPDDHFMVVVTTKRCKQENFPEKKPSFQRTTSDETTEAIVSHLAKMSTSSPVLLPTQLPSCRLAPQVEIEYTSGRIKRLAPVPLPPPAIFFPPFSTDASSAEDEESNSEETESSEAFMSQQVNPHQSDGYPDGIDLTSGDEDGEEPDETPDHPMYGVDGEEYSRMLPDRRRQSSLRSSSAAAAAGTARGRSKSESKSISADMPQGAEGSSVATAGGVESGYSSSDEGSHE